jgi:hypothetical protein
MQTRARRQGEKIEPAGGDVFSQFTGRHGKAGLAQFGEQFRMDKMDLTAVRGRRISAPMHDMLDGDPVMGIVLDAQAGMQPDGGKCRLGKYVCRAAANRSNQALHDVHPFSRPASHASVQHLYCCSFQPYARSFFALQHGCPATGGKKR